MHDTAMAEQTLGEKRMSLDADPGRHLGSIPTTVAISGDRIVGRALALLLQSSHNDVRFLPVSVLAKSGQLVNVRLLLLTPLRNLSGAHREILLRVLRNPASGANMLVLVLSSISGMVQELDGIDPRCVLRWPCGIRELERRIEEILANQATANPN